MDRLERGKGGKVEGQGVEIKISNHGYQSLSLQQHRHTHYTLFCWQNKF